MLRSKRVAALAMAALIGCGGGSSPTPTVPNVVGTYMGTWDFLLVGSDGSVPFELSCDCTFEIPSQSGQTFFGRSATAAPCDVIIPLSDGFIETNGQIRFQLLTDFFGGACEITNRPPLSGTFSGSTISVQRTESYDCTAVDGLTYEATIRLNVSR